MLLKCPSSWSQIYQNGYLKIVIKDSTEDEKKNEKRAPLKTPAWEANKGRAKLQFQVSL